MPNVFLFPGQSARYRGMLDRVVKLHPPGAAVVERASHLLGRDLLQATRCFEDNRDVQTGVFVTTHLYLEWLESQGYRADLSLGVSLGEYNHLVHIGALDFMDALRLVDLRGRLYREGPPGQMVVLARIAEEDLEERLRGTEVEVAGQLAPRVFMVGGPAGPVGRVVQRIEAEVPSVLVRYLASELPMHCSLFRPVAERFRPHLMAAPFRRPALPYLPNVLGEWVDAPDPASLVDLLDRHVWRRMLWCRSVDAALARCPGATVVEVGPNWTLSKVFAMARDWHPGVPRLAAEDLAGHQPPTPVPSPSTPPAPDRSSR